MMPFASSVYIWGRDGGDGKGETSITEAVLCGGCTIGPPERTQVHLTMRPCLPLPTKTRKTATPPSSKMKPLSQTLLLSSNREPMPKSTVNSAQFSQINCSLGMNIVHGDRKTSIWFWGRFDRTERKHAKRQGKRMLRRGKSAGRNTKGDEKDASEVEQHADARAREALIPEQRSPAARSRNRPNKERDSARYD